MDRGINPDSWDGILSTRGSKLTLIAYVLSARHGARSFQNDYFHWGKKVFCHVEKIMSQSQDMSLNVNFIHAFNKSTMI